jgi:hypothetical protein
MGNGEDKELSRAYLDILNGYSKIKYGAELLYVKHFGIFDESLVSENYEIIFEKTKAQGLPTEAERLEVLEEQGFWTKGDERKIQFKREEMKELETRLSKTIIKKQKEKVLKELKDLRGQINEEESKRGEMLHDTCESFARSKSMNHLIWLSFYKDSKFKKRAWKREEFDALSRAELSEVVALYNLKMMEISASNIKKIALSGFFTNYFYLTGDNIADFFGKRILDLTFFQTTLVSFGKMFKNIQENNSNIPESVLEDPDSLLDFAKSKSENEGSKAIDTEGGYSRVGATKEDMIDAGVSSAGAADLHDLARSKGGQLGWQDFA